MSGKSQPYSSFKNILDGLGRELGWSMCFPHKHEDLSLVPNKDAGHGVSKSWYWEDEIGEPLGFALPQPSLISALQSNSASKKVGRVPDNDT